VSSKRNTSRQGPSRRAVEGADDEQEHGESGERRRRGGGTAVMRHPSSAGTDREEGVGVASTSCVGWLDEVVSSKGLLYL
jgi:hypothetical protein